MDKSTLLKGESKTLEFKAALSSKSESYLKTVVAFANTDGGRLIFGIDDKSRQVVGVEKDDVFKIMDAIANAVSDSCAPKIVPDISFETIEDKTVVLVDIAAGFNRPYMLKSGGLDKGVYVRVGATSRPADTEQIREMMLDGSNQSWDEQICRSYALTDRAVKKLCSDINRYRTEKDGQNAPKTTKETLIGWGVLKQDKTEVLPTNAFALLTDNPFGQAKIQCAVFKGESKSVFLDRKEYEGSLCRLLEDAYQYVLRNIRMGAVIEGLIRQDKFELPPAAIREMICNAICHRSYMDEGMIQVSVFDDRLEVSSPGALCRGLTLKDALKGRSKPRNKVIAEVFSRMGIIEKWGTGLQRIVDLAKQEGLKEPVFENNDSFFRVILYRGKEETAQTTDQTAQTTDQTAQTTDQTVQTTDQTVHTTEQKIMNAIAEKPTITRKELAEKTGLSESGIKWQLDKLKKEQKILRAGGTFGGHWVVKK